MAADGKKRFDLRSAVVRVVLGAILGTLVGFIGATEKMDLFTVLMSAFVTGTLVVAFGDRLWKFVRKFGP